MPKRVCPDCDVELEQVDHSTEGSAGGSGRVSIDDPRKGGPLGIGGTEYLEAYLCEDCGLVRFYAGE